MVYHKSTKFRKDLFSRLYCRMRNSGKVSRDPKIAKFNSREIVVEEIRLSQNFKILQMINIRIILKS